MDVTDILAERVAQEGAGVAVLRGERAWLPWVGHSGVGTAAALQSCSTVATFLNLVCPGLSHWLALRCPPGLTRRVARLAATQSKQERVHKRPGLSLWTDCFKVEAATSLRFSVWEQATRP